MRLLAAALLVAIVLSGCSDSPSGDSGDASSTSSSTSSTGNSTTSRSNSSTIPSSTTTTTTASQTTTTSSNTTTTSSTATTTSSTTTSTSGNGTSNGTGSPAKPAPVTKSCSNTGLNFGTGPVACTTTAIESSNGASFSSINVSVTWTTPGTDLDITIKDNTGTTIATGAGLTSPINFSVPAANVPKATSFTLTMSATGVFAGFSPTATFTVT